MRFSTANHYKKEKNYPKASPSTRMLTYRPLPPIDYSPYLEEEKETDGLLGKVTSKITGMIKDLKSAVGSMFKPHEEEHIRLSQSQPLGRHILARDVNVTNLQNHPINQVNFSDLGKILNNSEVPKNKEFQEENKNGINAMNMSFGGQNKIIFDAEIANQTILSFHPQESFQIDGKMNGSELSEQLGKISPSLDKHGKLKKREKMNLMRVLNFCHVLFEQKNEKYSQSCPKSFNTNLKTLLIKGIIKPKPLRSTLPSIEFKYNKVIGKLEVTRFLKKRKRTEDDPLEDKKQEDMELSLPIVEDKTEAVQHGHKRKRMTMPSKLEDKNVFINFKGTPKRSVGKVSSNKKPSIFINNFETYETDETDEPEFKKSSPFRDTIFEEDKEEEEKPRDMMVQSQSQETNNSHTTLKKDQSSQTSDMKQSRVKFNDLVCKPTSPLRSKSLSRLASIEKDIFLDEKEPSSPKMRNIDSQKEIIEDKEPLKPLEVPQAEPMVLSQGEDNSQKQIEQNEINNDVAQETMEQKKDEENKDESQPIEPKTPAFRMSENKESIFQFDNDMEEKNADQKEEEKAEANAPQNNQVLNLFADKKDDTNTSTQNLPANSLFKPLFGTQNDKKIEPVEPVLPQPVVQEKKIEAPVPDFLKSYLPGASSDQKEKEKMENNPFLTKKSSSDGLFPFLKSDNQANAASKTEIPNPFLQPTKSEPPALFKFLSNSSATNNTPDLTKSLSSGPNLNLFNSQPSPIAQNLFSPQTPSFNQNSTNLFSENKTTNMPASGLFSYLNQESKPNSVLPQNPFQSGLRMGSGDMERESSVGMQNNLFAQKPLGGMNLFDNNASKGLNMFSNLQNNNTGIGQSSQNLFQSPPLGMLSSSPNNATGQNSLFNNTMSPPQTSSFNLFGNASTPQVAPTNNFLNLSQNVTNQQPNLFSSGGNQLGTNNSLSQNTASNFLSQNNMGSTQGSNLFQNNGMQSRDAENFLGGGDSNNNNNTTQGRVYRRIIQPNTKSRDRAF